MDAVHIDTADGEHNEDAIESTVSDVCRVCLIGNLLMRDLFIENDVVSLSTKAMSFASVKMLPGDGLPAQVCCECADKLDSAYEFKLQVEQADNVLRQRFDSINIKEELFFNEVEVHLEAERADDVHALEVDAHYQATVESLTVNDVEDEKPTLLKDHLALLEVEKLAQQEQMNESVQKQDENVDEESNVNGILQSGEEQDMEEDEYLQGNIETNGGLEDCDVYRTSVKSECMNDGTEGITIEEHNYIMQQGYTLSRNEDELVAQESEDSGAHESTEYLSLIETDMGEKSDDNDVEMLDAVKLEDEEQRLQQQQQQQHDQGHDQEEDQKIEHDEEPEEKLDISQSDTRRSKRKLSKRGVGRHSDEDNYFENLNLSSRLKRAQSEKPEKVFFLCYLCDKQFVSKEILKEHMHSHEEVRRTLSLHKTEKLEKKSWPSPSKGGIGSATPVSATSISSSSGKRANKCPYCGKEYLYVISFNKHLKQHEKNKDSTRDGSMSVGDSARGDEDMSDFASYDDTGTSVTNSRVEQGNEDESNEEMGLEKKRRKRRKSGRADALYMCDKCFVKFSCKRELDDHAIEHDTCFKCSTCDQEFDALDKLRRHRSEHVVEGVLSEQDLEDNVYEREFDAEAPDDAGNEIYEGVTEEHLETSGQEHDDDDEQQQSARIDEDEDEYRLELQESVENNEEQFAEIEGQDGECREGEIEENWSESKDLKCPNCPMVFAHKKALVKHMETHTETVYACKVCKQEFLRKDLLQRHAQEHVRAKTFKCTQCDKTFGNELTLRNHLIATNHKTIVHGQEYDPNKRLKRVAAKAAQKIIDKIKTEDGMEEYDEEDEEAGGRNSKGNAKWLRFDEKNNQTNSTRKTQHQNRNRRRCDLECATCGRKCSSKQSLMKHMEQQHGKDEKFDLADKSEKGRKNNNVEIGERSRSGAQQTAGPLVTQNDRMEADEEDNDNNSDFESGLDWPMDNHECPTCKKRYSTKKSLLRHQLLHEEPNFECDICNVKFYRKDKLKAHYDKCSEKNPDQVRKCNICGDSFENNEMLREHRGKHVDEGILTEEDLREIEPGLDDRKESGKVARKRRTDIVGLECTECNKRYTSRKGLLRHIQVHEGKKYLCDICPKKFYRREHLKIHVAKHNMIKPYKCSRCTKRFIKEEQLVNHLSKHDRTFKKNKETDSSKRFLCEICSKSFTQSTTLIAHLRAHNGIKPYVCEVCARPFTTNAYLKMHMRTHTQERPYSCQYCSRAFARADTLANHLTSHTGEAKYHCKYCPKNFRRLKSLKEHVFIHTGQRPYSCPTCDRRFNNNGSRYAHSKRCKQNLLQSQNRSQNMPNTIVQTASQPLRIHQITTAHPEHTTAMQVVKSQNIKTITIARPADQVTAHQVIQHQEILMPLILPLTVTLTDVDEEVVLSEGTKIFTTT